MLRKSLRLWLLTAAITAIGQVPGRRWTAVLGAPGQSPGIGVEFNTHQAPLTSAQATAVTRFVQAQFKVHPLPWEGTPHGERLCPSDQAVFYQISPQCVNVREGPLGIGHAFYVAAQPALPNPIGWILKVDSGRAVELSGLLVGYLNILDQRHEGAHDLVVINRFGPAQETVTLLQFHNGRYRSMETHKFVVCSQLPGHARDDVSWCREKGRHFQVPEAR